MRTAGNASLLIALLALVAIDARAQITVNPTGVSTRTLGPTTAFLTFRGLAPNQVPAEGIWCGAINPDGSCVAGTIFGRLPARSDLGRTSDSNNFTDIMTIPPSVSRRAYQSALQGAASEFFYVRSFTGGGADEFVPVSCRLAGGGARVPFSLVDVKLRFELDRPVLYVPRESHPPPLGAQIVYNGTGRIKGRWEVVFPSDPQPSVEDLLPAGSLPEELRARQRRYTLIDRFDFFLPPGGTFFLPGPDPNKLPNELDGLYLVLLRVEATDDGEARSNTLGGSALSGGAAGFPLPALRYYVGTGENREVIATLAATENLQLIVPMPDARLEAGQRLNFSWIGRDDAAVYRLEVEGAEGRLLEALLGSTVVSYSAPPFVAQRAGEPLRWRVVAIDANGRPFSRSRWRSFEIRR